MGLKLVPENNHVFVYEKGEIDAWGLSAGTSNKKKLGCFLRGSESSTPLESTGGRMVIPTYDITFNGNVPVFVGDIVEVEGHRFTVLSRKPKQDLSGNVLILKISV